MHRHRQIHTHTQHITHIYTTHNTHTHNTHTYMKLMSFLVPQQCVVHQEAANYIHADPRSREAKEVEAASSLLETHNTHVDFTTMSGLYKEIGAVGRNKVKWLSNVAITKI
jgi:hypothetical protein